MRIALLSLGTILLVGFSVFAGRAQPDAGAVTDQDPRPLRLLMVELGQDMSRISDGMWHADFEMIREGARGIADHPKIAQEEVQTIKQTLGEEFEQFVSFDKMVHRTADELAAVAVEENMDRVLGLQNQLEQGCVGCHAAYRDRVRGALY